MSSSEEAFTFFREWMKSKTKLAVTGVLDGVVVSGVGFIETLDEHLFLVNRPSSFSVLIPLVGCRFEASDPERSTGFPALDESVREAGFKFGWEVILPSADRILLTEFGDLTDT